MKFAIKIFEFKGIPVYLKYWFFLLFVWLNPIYVISIFISVLLHEIAHAAMARKLGYDVTDIQIDVFHGSANMNLDIVTPKHMLLIALSGPWVNITLTSVFLFLSSFGINNIFIHSMLVVNFIFFLFNIIPIFPLDGGRIFRSALIIKTGNEDKSIRISAFVSLVLSILLLVFYIYNFSILMIFFSIIFILYSLMELGWIKKPID